MGISQSLDAVNQGIIAVAKISAPILIISMAVGLVIAILQAATQIHEQTLTFVPKFAVILLIIVMTGNWMMTEMVEFFQRLCNMMIL